MALQLQQHISARAQRHNLLFKLLWIKLQQFPWDFVSFVHFYVLPQLLAFSLCSLRHLVLFQGLGKRKIAVCIYKQTVKNRSTMYWHWRICSVIRTFLGSLRLSLCTENNISSPSLTSFLIKVLFIHASFSFPKKCPLRVRSCSHNCLLEEWGSLMDLEKIAPWWPFLALSHANHLPLNLCVCALL